MENRRGVCMRGSSVASAACSALGWGARHSKLGLHPSVQCPTWLALCSPRDSETLPENQAAPLPATLSLFTFKFVLFLEGVGVI